MNAAIKLAVDTLRLLPLVRSISSRNGRIIYLVVDEDPDELLERAMEVERFACEVHPDRDVDIRILRRDPEWSEECLPKGTETHYRREPR